MSGKRLKSFVTTTAELNMTRHAGRSSAADEFVRETGREIEEGQMCDGI